MIRIFIVSIFILFNCFFAFSQVNSNLFGFRTSTSFIFFDVKDSIFVNSVKSISPNVLSFPGSFGNFYHLEGIGYGLDIAEIQYYHTGKKSKQARGLNRIAKKKSHTRNYIYDFIDLVKQTNSHVIYDANIISSTPQEVLDIIQLFISNDISLLGVELGGELSNRAYAHLMDIEKYITLSKLYADSIKSVYKDISIGVVAAPNNRGLIRLSEWNRKLAKETFYDAIIIHPYAKVVSGIDVAGQMLTVNPEGSSLQETYEIYRGRAIKYIMLDFKEEIDAYVKLYNKPIWLTEWNMQMSSVTGNTLLQALFVAHQLIELASFQNSNIDIATFHNLAGRTLSGDMIMMDNKKSKTNATFNSMRIVNTLFSDSLSFLHKYTLQEGIFEYCFVHLKNNRRVYYWINWSEYSKKVDMSYFVGKQSEYFGRNLFQKNIESNKLEYNVINVRGNEIELKPYSITLLEQIN